MCGIAGILDPSRTPDPRALRRMAAALGHRGPDERGLFRDNRMGLVHTRLSIIDLASGQQPLANEDDSLFIVFNGEIFNYVELREELVALGHRFRTRSDTEVIVHAFESWGEAAFARFNGQFALALWDARAHRLVLARDRLGVRPLHLAEHDGRLYFASEVKAIFAADRNIARAFDARGLDDTFTFWASLAPNTPFTSVRELGPGRVLIVEGTERDEHPYFAPHFPRSREEQFQGTIEEATEAVTAALEEATRLRVLRSEVPVGSYLSGGLDSSLIAALAIRQRAGKLSTFSLRFEDAEYDETPFQRTMATRLESDHHELVVSRRDIADAFPRVVFHAERPLLRAAPGPLFLLSNLVQGLGTKVVLTGEGADEMFAGYDIFREAKVRRFWAKDPGSRLRPLLLKRLYPYLTRSPVAEQEMAKKFFGRNLSGHARADFAHEPRWSSAHALSRLFSRDVKAAVAGRSAPAELTLPEDFARWSPLARAQHLEIATLLSPYILCSQGDRMMMAHSVEGRFPFLDVNVVALANSLPESFKLKGLDEKHVLKRVAERLVPKEIVRRTKQPYRAPDALSFVDTPPPWVELVLSEREVQKAGVFDPALITALWKKCVGRRESGQFSNADNMALVGVLSTQLLHRQVLEAEPVDGERLHFKTVLDKTAEASA